MKGIIDLSIVKKIKKSKKLFFQRNKKKRHWNIWYIVTKVSWVFPWGGQKGVVVAFFFGNSQRKRPPPPF